MNLVEFIIPFVIFGAILYGLSVGLFITLCKWLNATAIKIILMAGAAGFMVMAGGSAAIVIKLTVDWIFG